MPTQEQGHPGLELAPQLGFPYLLLMSTRAMSTRARFAWREASRFSASGTRLAYLSQLELLLAPIQDKWTGQVVE